MSNNSNDMDIDDNRKKNNNTVSKTNFKDSVVKFYQQLTNGCGNSNCINIFCASCKGFLKLDLNKAGITAVSLARDPNPNQFSCNGTYPNAQSLTFLGVVDEVRFLNEPIVEGLTSSPSNSYISELEAVFSDPRSLSISFLKSLKDFKFDGSDTGLDISSVRRTYKILSAMPREARSTIGSSIKKLLDNLSKIKNPKSLLRVYLILLENPMLVEDDFFQSSGTLFHLITQNQEFLHYLFEHHLHQLDEDQFLAFHHRLHDWISIKIIQSDYKDSINDNQGIVGITKVFEILWRINWKKKWLKLQQFYNQVLNDFLSLKEDFTNWKKRSPSKLSFCNYPFLLTPETKSNMLNIESIIQQKRRHEESLQALAQGWLDIPYLHISVRRDHLIEDSLDRMAVIKMTDSSDLKKQLRVKFEGEDGIDEGGVQKEWFQLLVAEIFSVKYGMFIADEETRTHFFNQHSLEVAEFELLGSLLGLAIYNGVILDLHFPISIYKKLLGRPVGMEDLQEIRPNLASGLQQLLEYNGDDFEETFSITFRIFFDYYGKQEYYDLLPDGDEIPVTLENRQMYVDLYVQYLLNIAVEKQFAAFKRGFSLVCEGGAVFKLFEPEELLLVICGSPELDFKELELHTIYDNGYDKDHSTIKNFWNVVHSFDLDQKKKLLFFTTGSDRAPIGGLAKLNLIITKHGEDSDRLPTSHTCFNHLLLPAYKEKEKLANLLEKAINNATGFGLF